MPDTLYSAGLLAIRGFHPCLSDEVWISPSVLKCSGYRTLGGRLFSWHFKQALHCLLACIVCSKKSAVTVIFVGLFSSTRLPEHLRSLLFSGLNVCVGAYLAWCFLSPLDQWFSVLTLNLSLAILGYNV